MKQQILADFLEYVKKKNPNMAWVRVLEMDLEDYLKKAKKDMP